MDDLIKPIFIAIGLIAIFGSGYYIGHQQQAASNPTVTVRSADNTVTVTGPVQAIPTPAITGKYTLKQYQQVQKGMTYEQVKQIFGSDGQQIYEQTYPATENNPEQKIQSFQWANSTNSYAAITFTNGKVETLNQSFLPP